MMTPGFVGCFRINGLDGDSALKERKLQHSHLTLVGKHHQ